MDHRQQPGNETPSGSEPTLGQPGVHPLRRRHAFRALAAGLASALGAVLLGARHPETAVAADPLGNFSTTVSDPNPAVTATSTSDGPFAYAINASTDVEGQAVIVAVNNGGGYGVLGSSNPKGGIGVIGSTVSATNPGVEGDNDGGGPAVYGNNTSGGHGVGVLGRTGSAKNAAVEGDNSGTGPGVLGNSNGGGAGVQGMSFGASGGYGVTGMASNDANSIGVLGSSTTGNAVVGYCSAAAGAGVVASNFASGYGIVGHSASGQAVYASGNVWITGSLTVQGAKMAVVRDAGGSLRKVYCVESPESWFEDFGSGRLSDGSATVQLDPGFAQLVRTDDYHVFLTAAGPSKGLYVSSRSAGSFSVQEDGGGTGSVAFDYRVVARRKDIAGVRLERVDEPPAPSLPKPPFPV